MSRQKKTLSKNNIVGISKEVEKRIVSSLKKYIAKEGKKSEARIRFLGFGIERYLGWIKSEIIKSIQENEQTLEILARELARQRKRQK